MLSLEKELITIKTMYNCDQHQQNVAAPQHHHRCDGGVALPELFDYLFILKQLRF